MADPKQEAKKKKVERKLEVVPTGNDETCATIVLHNEDHTLGNAVRYFIAKNPKTSFCGYSIPHPAEAKLNVRVQTKGPDAATEVFAESLDTLIAVGEHILTTFDKADKSFAKAQKAASS